MYRPFKGARNETSEILPNTLKNTYVIIPKLKINANTPP